MLTSIMKERRYHQREVFYREVAATHSDGSASKLLSINYSNSGIALISFTPIMVGEVFELEFTFDNNNDASRHKLTAEVVQSHNVSDIYVLGLRFIEASS